MSPRQRLHAALLVGCLFIFLAGPARGAKLYVVYASISGTQAIGWVAKEAGLFAKHGLDERWHRQKGTNVGFCKEEGHDRRELREDRLS